MIARAHRIVLVVVLAARGSARPSQPPPKDPPPMTPMTPTTPEPERPGTVRADPTAAWIELGGTRLALDGDRELWSQFADRDVIVTGVCVGDGAQFHIHTLRTAEQTRGMGPYF